MHPVGGVDAAEHERARAPLDHVAVTRERIVARDRRGIRPRHLEDRLEFLRRPSDRTSCRALRRPCRRRAPPAPGVTANVPVKSGSISVSLPPARTNTAPPSAAPPPPPLRPLPPNLPPSANVDRPEPPAPPPHPPARAAVRAANRRRRRPRRIRRGRRARLDRRRLRRRSLRPVPPGRGPSTATATAAVPPDRTRPERRRPRRLRRSPRRRLPTLL